MLFGLEMVEAICLTLIGGCLHILVFKTKPRDERIRYLAIAGGAGIFAFAMFGEPSSATAIPYGAIGFSAPVFLKKKFKEWMNKLVGGK